MKIQWALILAFQPIQNHHKCCKSTDKYSYALSAFFIQPNAAVTSEAQFLPYFNNRYLVQFNFHTPSSKAAKSIAPCSLDADSPQHMTGIEPEIMVISCDGGCQIHEFYSCDLRCATAAITLDTDHMFHGSDQS